MRDYQLHVGAAWRPGQGRLGQHQRLDQPVRVPSHGRVGARYPMDTFTEPKTVVYPAPRYV